MSRALFAGICWAALAALGACNRGDAAPGDDEALVQTLDRNLVGIACQDADGQPLGVMYAANPISLNGAGRMVFTKGTLEGVTQGVVGEPQTIIDGMARDNLSCGFTAYAVVVNPPFRVLNPAYTSKFTCRDLHEPFDEERIVIQGEVRGGLTFDWRTGAISHPHMTGNQIVTLPEKFDADAILNCSFTPGQVTPGVEYKGIPG